MALYLDPKADIVFKKIFAEHPHLLISFLNAVLPLPDDAPIVELTYLQPEQLPEIPAFKRTIVDVKCTDSKKRVFIVEMQVNWTDAFKQRLLFSSSQAIVRQVARGEEYHLLQPVYGLGLSASVFAKEDPVWYHHYQLVKQGSEGEDIIDHLQLIFIELPKFPVTSPTEKRLRLLWLRFLRDIGENTEQAPKEFLEVPEIAEALSFAREAGYSREELMSYGEYWKAVSSERTLLAAAESKGKEIGKEIGLAEGEEIGLAKGKEIGLVEGENLGLRKAALGMLKKGLPLELIAEATGLSLEVLNRLDQ